MKKHSILLTALVCALAFGAFYFSGRQPVMAQKAAQATPANLVSKTSETKAARTDSESGRFSAAANSNAATLRTLSWPFGGRSQKGWEIYVPLIAHTIGTDDGPTSPGFAASIADWQRKNGLEGTGTIDAATLQAFVKFWQGERRLGASRAAVTELISAPSTNFWDPNRPVELTQLDSSAYAAYQRMLAAAPKEVTAGQFLKIVSAYRSPEYQAALRKREPNAGTAALAKNSPHFTGRALDIFVGGEPVTTRDDNRLLQVQTPAYKWLVKNAHKFGFYPYFYEPWHWEFVPGR